MEKITSGLPPSLYHYTTHHTITPHPQNTQTLITPFALLSLSLPVYTHPQTIRFIVPLQYRFLPLSLSLSLLYLTPPLLSSHKGFDFFFLTAIGGISILVLFTRTILHFNLLHYRASMWLLSVDI